MAGHLKRSGLTLKEMLIVVAIIAILLAVFTPLVRYVRESTRRVTCQTNLKHWGLAVMNYEYGHMQLPPGVGFKRRGIVTQSPPLSGFVSVFPYVAGCNVSPYGDFASPTVVNGVQYPAYGVSLSESKYWLWELEIDSLICPSAEPSKSAFGRTSYAFSIGDVARNISQQETLRGPYGYFKANRIGAVIDGTSNTIGIIEIGGSKTETIKGGCWMNGKATWLDDPSRVLSLIKNGSYPLTAKTIGRGSHWGDGRASVGLANTILPPNSPSFQVQGSPTDDGIYSAGSMHPGGVNVAFLDGSTHFIADDVDAGDPSTPTLSIEQMESGQLSPHGLWGALGTVGTGESMELNF